MSITGVSPLDMFMSDLCQIYVAGPFWARKNPLPLALTRGNGFLSLAVTEGFEL